MARYGNPRQYGKPPGVHYGKPGQVGHTSSSFTPPTTYPTENLATEIWHWGTHASGSYVTPITGDVYVDGSGGTPGHLYEQTGPPGSNMKSIYWRNDGSFNSHHTAPGTTAGQSNGAVDASLIPGSSSFKFYFYMKSVNGPEGFYYFFDYDQQNSAVAFNPGIQFFISTAGVFAPCSLVALMKDDSAQFGQYHAKTGGTGGTRLFEDNLWHFVEMIFDKSGSLPTFKIDGETLAVVNTFGGPALSSIGTITPVAGIRFGMREFGEIETGRADLMMAAAAYSKNLSYTWS